MHSPPELSKEPIEYFYPGWNGDSHGHDRKKGVHISASTHGEKMVQPNDKGEKGNHSQGPYHGDIAE